MLKSNNPLAVDENGRFAFIVTDARNLQIRRTHHKVHVFDGIVHAELFKFFNGQLRAAFNRRGVALSEREMAACILVEKGVVK